MMFEEVITECSDPYVRERYTFWCRFMEQNVRFWREDSELHTKQHCARVLLFALLIGRKERLVSEEIEALAQAGVFHDARRQNDWLDVGHGQRAAKYYQAYCKENHLQFDQCAYYAMYYHDRPDEDGIREIQSASNGDSRWIAIYRIFKDADALDRFRLGAGGLDIRYLRTDAARNLIAYAKDVFERTRSHETENRKGAI